MAKSKKSSALYIRDAPPELSEWIEKERKRIKQSNKHRKIVSAGECLANLVKCCQESSNS